MSTPETPDAAAGADTPTAESSTPVGLAPPVPAAQTVPATADIAPPPFADTRPPAWEPPTAAPALPEPAASVDPTGPRVRWAGIVWGLVLAAIAAVALWILLDPARQAALTSWLVDLNPATAIAIAVLLLGLFALITGIVGIARRAQRGLERRRAASVPGRVA
ncbi:hypothetical protein ACI3KY_16015 [Microbacterium sp. ZW T2_14]|uniref:hypothetical protein n=1 Tax=Microbacterium sp. ZW T2_14 TaxID=3378079 RepID=UPI003851E269